MDMEESAESRIEDTARPGSRKLHLTYVRPSSALERRPGLALPRALASLRHRNYRLLWIGSLISHSGDWMDQVALNWLVYQLTGSAVYLGVLNFCRLVPILVFTLIGGVVADRVERRR